MSVMVYQNCAIESTVVVVVVADLHVVFDEVHEHVADEDEDDDNVGVVVVAVVEVDIAMMLVPVPLTEVKWVYC